MSYFFKVFCLFLLLNPFFSTSTSLDYDWKLDANIMKINEKRNLIVLNIGTQEGVKQKDVVKIYEGKGGRFLAQGVCLIALEELSEWIVHYSYLQEEFLVGDIVQVINPYREGKKIRIEGWEDFLENSILLEESSH